MSPGLETKARPKKHTAGAWPGATFSTTFPKKPVKNAHYHAIFLAWKKILWQRKNNTCRKGSKKMAFAVYLW